VSRQEIIVVLDLMKAVMQKYLLAGFRVKTDLFNSHLKTPGVPGGLLFLSARAIGKRQFPRNGEERNGWDADKRGSFDPPARKRGVLSPVPFGGVYPELVEGLRERTPPFQVSAVWNTR
jgi:hypothetical protein